MTPHTALLEAIRIFGTQQLLAQKVGCKQSTISGCVKRKTGASPRFAYWISEAVDFQVTPHQLCPSAFPKNFTA